MKRSIAFCLLFFAAAFCFSQSIIVKGETTWLDGAAYRVQVGAYRIQRNADLAFNRLSKTGLNADYENSRSLVRVLLAEVRAREMPLLLEKIRAAGFAEVWITREETLNEKWEIANPDSKYSSFEFSGGNYIVVENAPGGNAPPIHFGDYAVRSKNDIELIDLGTVKITSRDDEKVAFSFTDTAARETSYEGEIAPAVSASPKTDMFSKTWRVKRINGKDTAGTENDKTLVFSTAGTYLVVNPDGKSAMARWRWKDADERDFQYSWDNWEDYGTCIIEDLTADRLSFEDSTYGGIVPVPELVELAPKQ